MKYKVVKPENPNEYPLWTPAMDYLNGHIIDEKEIEIHCSSDGDSYFEIKTNRIPWKINLRWATPLIEGSQFLLGF